MTANLCTDTVLLESGAQYYSRLRFLFIYYYYYYKWW